MNLPGEKRARHSFILLEALASLSVLSLIVAGITTGAIAVMETGNYVADAAAAQDRADQVFSMLKLPADFCGYGMPRSAELYQEAFAHAERRAPFDWDGVISVTDSQMKNGGVRKNGKCRIVYGIQYNNRIMDSAVISDEIFKIRVIGNKARLDLLKPVETPYRPKTVKNWVLCGSALPSACPMWLSGDMKESGSATILNLVWNKAGSPEAEITIHKNDYLFYMDAIECEVNIKDGGEEIFYIKDMREGAWQPRERGVIDARFALDPGRRMLRVLLLVRGDRRYDQIKTKDTPPGWPQEYAPDITPAARHYRLFTFAESFELKNI